MLSKNMSKKNAILHSSGVKNCDHSQKLMTLAVTTISTLATSIQIAIYNHPSTNPNDGCIKRVAKALNAPDNGYADDNSPTAFIRK